MLLRDVRLIVSRGPSTLSQISAETGAQKELVRQALRFWVERGDIEVTGGVRVSLASTGGDGEDVSCAGAPGCGSCGTMAADREITTTAPGPAVYQLRTR